MRPANYLIRFDDVCPAMNWDVWQYVEHVLATHMVRPLVAVVPDNRDPYLDVQAPRLDFWERVRGWQARGWAIGLHGYQHLYTTNDAGLLGRNCYSEFAGVPEAEQRAKLAAGLDIFHANGVRADCFIAPAHSFDEHTLDALTGLGIGAISDGYALAPYRCRRGLMWVPQQLGSFRHMPFGTWTVCLHANSWTVQDIVAFDASLTAFRSQITTFDALSARFGERHEDWTDRFTFRSLRAARALRS